MIQSSHWGNLQTVFVLLHPVRGKEIFKINVCSGNVPMGGRPHLTHIPSVPPLTWACDTDSAKKVYSSWSFDASSGVGSLPSGWGKQRVALWSQKE